MPNNKELKYRAICPYCKNPFDTRTGKLYLGYLVCEECFKKIPYTTYLEDSEHN